MTTNFPLLLAFFVAFVLVADLFRRYRAIALAFFTLSLPSLLAPNSDLFMRIKTASVLLPTCFLVYARFKPRIERFIHRLIYAVIVLNIVEASVIDVKTGNYLNLIAAIALMLALPFSQKHWEISGRYNDYVVHLPGFWPLLYTSWNLCFLYSARISTFGYALPLLLAPLAYALVLRRTDLYFQARAYTFGFYLFFRAAFGDAELMNLPEFDLSAWYSSEFALAWSAANAAFAGALLYIHSSNRKRISTVTQRN
jgi:hypothetical protein